MSSLEFKLDSFPNSFIAIDDGQDTNKYRFGFTLNENARKRYALSYNLSESFSENSCRPPLVLALVVTPARGDTDVDAWFIYKKGDDNYRWHHLRISVNDLLSTNATRETDPFYNANESGLREGKRVQMKKFDPGSREGEEGEEGAGDLWEYTLDDTDNDMTDTDESVYVDHMLIDPRLLPGPARQPETKVDYSEWFAILGHHHQNSETKLAFRLNSANDYDLWKRLPEMDQSGPEFWKKVQDLSIIATTTFAKPFRCPFLHEQWSGRGPRVQQFFPTLSGFETHLRNNNTHRDLWGKFEEATKHKVHTIEARLRDFMLWFEKDGRKLGIAKELIPGNFKWDYRETQDTAQPNQRPRDKPKGPAGESVSCSFCGQKYSSTTIGLHENHECFKNRDSTANKLKKLLAEPGAIKFCPFWHDGRRHLMQFLDSDLRNFSQHLPKMHPEEYFDYSKSKDFNEPLPHKELNDKAKYDKFHSWFKRENKSPGGPFGSKTQ